jgi:hypothetical protein
MRQKLGAAREKIRAFAACVEESSIPCSPIPFKGQESIHANVSRRDAKIIVSFHRVGNSLGGLRRVYRRKSFFAGNAA